MTSNYNPNQSKFSFVCNDQEYDNLETLQSYTSMESIDTFHTHSTLMPDPEIQSDIDINEQSRIQEILEDDDYANKNSIDIEFRKGLESSIRTVFFVFGKFLNKFYSIPELNSG